MKYFQTVLLFTFLLQARFVIKMSDGDSVCESLQNYDGEIHLYHSCLLFIYIFRLHIC